MMSADSHGVDRVRPGPARRHVTSRASPKKVTRAAAPNPIADWARPRSRGRGRCGSTASISAWIGLAHVVLDLLELLARRGPPAAR